MSSEVNLLTNQQITPDIDTPSNNAGMASILAQETHQQKPQLNASPKLGHWLQAQGGSLAFTTYQSARLFLISPAANGQTEALERIVGSAMGLAVNGESLWVSNKEQAWRFSNVGAHRIGNQQCDAVYMPRRGYFLGPCDTHDLLANTRFNGQQHELLFVNTNFSCIAALDEHYGFRPVWKPDFISALSPEDRCHLNGMGAREGELAFATLCGRSDAPHGWKTVKNGGGCVVDINTQAILCEGLSMPHSPRWHDGRLWLLNSGMGEFGYVEAGRFVPVGHCPGFARGLTFVGGCAVIGVSRLRENAFSSDLPLRQQLASRHVRETCGLMVFDLATQTLVHWLNIQGPVTELYDVVFLPGVTTPYTPGFSEPELQSRMVHVPVTEFPVVPPRVSVFPAASTSANALKN